MGATELLFIFYDKWWMMWSERGRASGGRLNFGHFLLHFRQ